jgi:hypothetical protein
MTTSPPPRGRVTVGFDAEVVLVGVHVGQTWDSALPSMFRAKARPPAGVVPALHTHSRHQPRVPRLRHVACRDDVGDARLEVFINQDAVVEVEAGLDGELATGLRTDPSSPSTRGCP